MSDRIDRRAARSRKALHEALMRLVLQHDYESITVQQIIAAADVGRSTFYAHFTGKDDLLRAGFDELRRELSAVHGRSEDISLALFTHALASVPAYRALVRGRGGAVVDAAFRAVVAELLGGLTVRTAITDDLPTGLRARFAVDTFLAVLAWGLEQKESPAPEALDAMFHRLLGSGLGPDRGGED